MNPEKSVRGGCLCGAVRFMLELPSKWCAHCHCTMCRKYHGAGYVTWVGFERTRFTLASGENELRWHQSSKDAHRGFCNHCGSSLLFRSERWPGEIHVALGCLDDPIDREPQAHVYHDERVDWMSIDEALAVHDPN
jgi:hypothetical protein